MSLEALLCSVRQLHQDVLGDRLIGCYVHGSLALGGFQWSQSDMDFLTVVCTEPTQQQKEAMIDGLLRMESSAPFKGFEMSVICQEACKPFRYPTPYVLHYSRMHRPQAESNPAAYCRSMHGLDKDLAAHIAVTRQAGLVLCGKAIHEVFDPVPAACYLDSVLADIGEDATLSAEPAYTLLNLCRTWAYLEDGHIRSKQQGGQWALSRLPAREAGCIQAVLAYYAGTLAAYPPRDTLQACATWLLAQVRQKLPLYMKP